MVDNDNKPGTFDIHSDDWQERMLNSAIMLCIGSALLGAVAIAPLMLWRHSDLDWYYAVPWAIVATLMLLSLFFKVLKKLRADLENAKLAHEHKLRSSRDL